MKLPRKWSKIGHGLLLAGVIGLLLELLFGIPNMEVGWKDIAAVVWMVLSIVLAYGGVAVLQWKCRCPHCGAAVAVVGRCRPVLSALWHPAGI